MKSGILLILAMILLGWQSMGLADPTSTVSDVRVQTLKPYSYAFVSTQTTLNKLQDAIGQLMPKIDAAVGAGKLRPRGPYVFTYHGVTSDRDKPFTLDIGIMVSDGTTAPDGIQLIKVGPLHCATVIYSGSAREVGQSYGKLYGEINRRGLQPTDISREVYLYWEDADSENNLIQIQAELSAPAAAAPSPTN
jgi:effector-binding domain-containing protein